VLCLVTVKGRPVLGPSNADGQVYSFSRRWSPLSLASRYEPAAN
jgi:hypothetical protein